jgi:ABC-2 type transport system permease protein
VTGSGGTPLTLLLPADWAAHFVQYLPSVAGDRLFSGSLGVTDPLSPWTGFAVMCSYAAVLIGLAAWRLRRVDV